MPSATPDHREALRGIIAGPVVTMTNVMTLGGPEQKTVWRFWLDTLERYPLDLVSGAFDAFTRSGKRYVSPPDIVQIIEEKRRDAAVKLAEIEKREREEAADAEWVWRRANRVKPERAQAILEEYGFVKGADPLAKVADKLTNAKAKLGGS